MPYSQIIIKCWVSKQHWVKGFFVKPYWTIIRHNFTISLLSSIFSVEWNNGLLSTLLELLCILIWIGLWFVFAYCCWLELFSWSKDCVYLFNLCFQRFARWTFGCVVSSPTSRLGNSFHFIWPPIFCWSHPADNTVCWSTTCWRNSNHSSF